MYTLIFLNKHNKGGKKMGNSEKMPYRAFDHPEIIAKDEIVICNARKEVFDNLKWRTKRLGKQAFDYSGNPINPKTGLRPVFVRMFEFSQKGLDFYEIYGKAKKEFDKIMKE